MKPLAVATNHVGQRTNSKLYEHIVGVYRLLGYALGVNLNSLNLDNPINLVLMPAVGAGLVNYRIKEVTLNNPSISLTTAQVGLYTAVAAGGTELVSAQAVSSLDGVTKDLALTLAAGATGLVQTANTLYLRNTTAQSAAATADVYVWGVVYP